MISISEIDWLEAWYVLWCDGDWEHQYGLEFGTLSDQHGWTLLADLTDTQFEHCESRGVDVVRGPEDWITCNADAMAFRGKCGPWNLAEMVENFRQWSQGMPPLPARCEAPSRFLATLTDSWTQGDSHVPTSIEWLEELYRRTSVDDNKGLQVKIETLDNPGWKVTAKFATGKRCCGEGKFKFHRGWIEWKSGAEQFTAHTGPRNLAELLHLFRLWVEEGSELTVATLLAGRFSADELATGG